MAWYDRGKEQTTYALVIMGIAIALGLMGYAMAGGEGAMIGIVLGLLAITLF